LKSATLDSSVYIRALQFGGPAAVILGHARAGNIRIDISDAIATETIRVLRDKFQWNGYRVQQARGNLRSLGNIVSPAARLDVIREDPDDDRILECSIEAKSDFIVTEDNHLLHLDQFGGARIVTIRDFVRLALSLGTQLAGRASDRDYLAVEYSIGMELIAAVLHFEDTDTKPRIIQPHYVRDELIPGEAA